MRLIKQFAAAALLLVGGGTAAQQVTQPLSPAVAMPAARSTAISHPSPHMLESEDLTAWLDGFMPYAMRQGDIAGAVVTVVKDGQVIAAKGYGYADVAKRRPVDPARTLFRPGSVSKLITWTAVMQQVEAGKIDLDQDVNAYLDFRIPPYRGKPVTMRQIMTHSAGFADTVKNTFSYDAKTTPDLVTYMHMGVPRRIYAPGTTPAYSNWATTLAGYIVERVSGMPYDDYVEQRIFRPLDMQYSTFRQPLPGRLARHMSTGYDLGSGPAIGFEFIGTPPAGSLSASGVDMAKFMIAHLQQGKGLLKPKTAAMMHDSPLDRVDPMSLVPPLNRMELGFFETNINGREVIGHLGDLKNFHTALHLFLKEGVGLYVSFNSQGRDGGARVVRNQLFKGFADRYFPGTAADARVDAATSAEHARMMTGHWQVSRRFEGNFADIVNLVGQVKISVNDSGGLVVSALKQPSGKPLLWDEIAPFVWRERNGHDRLAAKLVDGKVVRWSYDGLSPFMVFDRVPASRSAGWLVPASLASIAILLLTVLHWPASWYLRRRYAAPHQTVAGALRVYRLTRTMALLTLVAIGSWTAFVINAFKSLVMNDSGDAVLWLLQIGGAITFLAMVAVAGWNAWTCWRQSQGWAPRMWSILLLIAALNIFYVAWTFGLLAMTVKY